MVSASAARDRRWIEIGLGRDDAHPIAELDLELLRQVLAEEDRRQRRPAVGGRGSDGQEQVTDMKPDASGGLGGFKAELPPQPGGAVYYQVVACDASGKKCAVSTGSKRKWHAVAIAASPVAKPTALQVASSKSPGYLPE